MDNKEHKESTFSKLWNNDRTHALMVLALWFVFFLIAIPLIKGLSSNQKPVFEKKLETKWEELLKNNYSFTYKITINGLDYVYSGERNDKITFGLKESSNEMVKYYIDDLLTYKVLLNNYEIIENIYENIDIKLLEPNDIYNLLKNQSSNEKDNKYTYLLDDYEIVVTTNKEAITNIKIIFAESIYDLSYTNIGKSEIKRIEVNKSE